MAKARLPFGCGFFWRSVLPSRSRLIASSSGRSSGSKASVRGRSARPSGPSVALRGHLQDDGGGQQAGEDQAVARVFLADPQAFDVEALALHGAEELLDLPALRVALGDVERVLDRLDGARGQQPPVHRPGAAGACIVGRGLLAKVDISHRDRLGAGLAVLLRRPELEPAEADRKPGGAGRHPGAGGQLERGMAEAAAPGRSLRPACRPPRARGRAWRAPPGRHGPGDGRRARTCPPRGPPPP